MPNLLHVQSGAWQTDAPYLRPMVTMVTRPHESLATCEETFYKTVDSTVESNLVQVKTKA